MRRIYKILIIFDKKIKDKEILYKGISKIQNNIEDNLYISMEKIELICKRSKDKSLDRILTDFKSTINKQITRALIYIIATKGYMPNIKEINIMKYDLNGIYLDCYKTEQVLQPIKTELPGYLKFNNNYLNILFKDNQKSEIILIALTYWIKGVTSLYEGDKFNKLWTSFNSLYSFISKEKSEIEKLIEMKNFIFKNKDKFNLSCNFFDKYNEKDIRKLQWRNLILNDYKEKVHTKAFHGFITRYYDYRMNKIFKEIICYRKEYLANENLLDSTNKHIDKCTHLSNKINVEVLAFYILKYAYFIRNKSFHGEKIDATFYIVKNDELEELNLLNNILSIFLKELITINDNY